MSSILFAVGVLLLGVAAVVIVAFLGVQRWLKPVLEGALERYWSEGQAAMEDRLAALEVDVGQLPRTWEEFATDAKKVHDRTRWHIRRVKSELAERGLLDEEIETLDGTLRRIDGEGGDSGGVRSLQDPVEEVPTGPPDQFTEVLRRKWGHG